MDVTSFLVYNTVEDNRLKTLLWPEKSASNLIKIAELKQLMIQNHQTFGIRNLKACGNIYYTAETCEAKFVCLSCRHINHEYKNPEKSKLMFELLYKNTVKTAFYQHIKMHHSLIRD